MNKKKSLYQMWILPTIIILVEIFYVWMIIYSFNDFSSFPVYLMILVIILTFLAIYSLFYSIIFGFTKITFSEKIIRKSFLNKWFLREFLWDEIVEVKRVYVTGTSFAWICFSRTPLDIMNYNQILKSKEVIRIIDTKRNRDIVSEFYDFDIH